MLDDIVYETLLKVSFVQIYPLYYLCRRIYQPPHIFLLYIGTIRIPIT